MIKQPFVNSSVFPCNAGCCENNRKELGVMTLVLRMPPCRFRLITRCSLLWGLIMHSRHEKNWRQLTHTSQTCQYSVACGPDFVSLPQPISEAILGHMQLLSFAHASCVCSAPSITPIAVQGTWWTKSVNDSFVSATRNKHYNGRFWFQKKFKFSQHERANALSLFSKEGYHWDVGEKDL